MAGELNPVGPCLIAVSRAIGLVEKVFGPWLMIHKQRADDITELVRILHSRPISFNEIRRRLRVLDHLYDFGIAVGIVSQHPVKACEAAMRIINQDSDATPRSHTGHRRRHPVRPVGENPRQRTIETVIDDWGSEVGRWMHEEPTFKTWQSKTGEWYVMERRSPPKASLVRFESLGRESIKRQAQQKVNSQTIPPWRKKGQLGIASRNTDAPPIKVAIVDETKAGPQLIVKGISKNCGFVTKAEADAIKGRMQQCVDAGDTWLHPDLWEARAEILARLRAEGCDGRTEIDADKFIRTYGFLHGTVVEANGRMRRHRYAHIGEVFTPKRLIEWIAWRPTVKAQALRVSSGVVDLPIAISRRSEDMHRELEAGKQVIETVACEHPALIPPDVRTSLIDVVDAQMLKALESERTRIQGAPRSRATLAYPSDKPNGQLRFPEHTPKGAKRSKKHLWLDVPEALKSHEAKEARKGHLEDELELKRSGALASMLTERIAGLQSLRARLDSYGDNRQFLADSLLPGASVTEILAVLHCEGLSNLVQSVPSLQAYVQKSLGSLLGTVPSEEVSDGTSLARSDDNAVRAAQAAGAFTAESLGRRLGVSGQSVRRWATQGGVPRRGSGKKRPFSLTELRRIEAQIPSEHPKKAVMAQVLAGFEKQ